MYNMANKLAFYKSVSVDSNVKPSESGLVFTGFSAETMFDSTYNNHGMYVFEQGFTAMGQGVITGYDTLSKILTKVSDTNSRDVYMFEDSNGNQTALTRADLWAKITAHFAYREFLKTTPKFETVSFKKVIAGEKAKKSVGASIPEGA
jgi:hypothetical protein